MIVCYSDFFPYAPSYILVYPFSSRMNILKQSTVEEMETAALLLCFRASDPALLSRWLPSALTGQQ